MTAAPLSSPLLPPLTRRLAIAGMVPFPVGALLVWLVWPDAHGYAVFALSTYAAVVVACLGGVHWALAMRDPAATSLIGWGALSPLAAWLAILMTPGAGLVLDGVLLCAGYAVDRRVYPRHGMAQWLMLRFRLSAIAALSCFIAAAGS